MKPPETKLYLYDISDIEMPSNSLKFTVLTLIGIAGILAWEINQLFAFLLIFSAVLVSLVIYIRDWTIREPDGIPVGELVLSDSEININGFTTELDQIKSIVFTVITIRNLKSLRTEGRHWQGFYLENGTRNEILIVKTNSSQKLNFLISSLSQLEQLKKWVAEHQEIASLNGQYV